MRNARALAAALAVLVTVPGARAQTIDPKIIREGQLGLRQDLQGGRVPDELKKRTQKAPAPQAPRAGFELQFIGGVELPKKSFADLIFIEFEQDGGRKFCTGLILDGRRSVVLTAAHCSCGRLDSYKVYARRGSDDERKETKVLTTPPLRYRDYTCFLPPEKQIGRDLAILRIGNVDDSTESFDELESVETFPIVRLADMHQVYRDRATIRLMGAGYGDTETGSPAEAGLGAFIPVRSFFCAGGRIAESECASFREFVLLDPRAGPGINRSDSCGGDSGAPIFWVSPKMSELEAVRLPYLVGVTSRALVGVSHNPGTTCGGGGIYTAVGHPDVTNWLAANGIYIRTESNAVEEKKSR